MKHRILKYFADACPAGSLLLASLLAAGLAAIPHAAHAQAATGVSLSAIYDFTAGNNGAAPVGLTEGTDGNLYGVTGSAGSSSNGTFFKITTGGSETTLHSFNGTTEGAGPTGPLALGSDGNFYGVTTGDAGESGYGTVFKVTPAGAVTTLHVFASNGADGTDPVSGLTLASDGNFYGVTSEGGVNGYGTIYKITPSGQETVLHSFNDTDGDSPDCIPTIGADGALYGTTNGDDNDTYGTIWKITTSGQFSLIYTFTKAGGLYEPDAGLTLANDGNLYGVASSGGTVGYGATFKLTLPTGTAAATVTALHSFQSYEDEQNVSPMILGSDGNLYGVAYEGGSNYTGSVYEQSTTGAFELLYNFTADNGYFQNSDGEAPDAPLVEVNGVFYGTTNYGGSDGGGVVFKVTAPSLAGPPLTPTSVSLSPSSVVGGSTNSTGTVTLSAKTVSAVTVNLSSNDTAAATVASSVTIPAGASSGTFPILSNAVTANASVTITATLNSVSETATLTVTPKTAAPALSSVTLTPASIVGGTSTTGNFVSLSTNATAGTAVTLTSSNTNVATVPSSVTIASGSASQVFTIATKSVTTTQTVTITAGYNGVTKTAVLTVTPASSGGLEARFDFNKDGHADLIWYNTGSGAISVWDMNDTTVLSYGSAFAQLAPSSGWQPVAAPDVNNDGYPDLIWWNSQSGALSAWTLQNTSVLNYGATFSSIADTNWKPVAAADVTGTTWELVFQNTSTGAISVWQMNGTTVTQYGGTLASLGAGSPWHVVGAPDLTGDGKSDLLFWNSSTGEVSYWGCDLAAGKVNSYNGDIAQVQDTTWHLVGSEDTNGDGHPDLIWWNAKSGYESRWLMNGTTVTQYGGNTAQVQDTTWQPTAIR